MSSTLRIETGNVIAAHMPNTISALGKMARFLRAVGLGQLLGWSRDTIDYINMRIGFTPLRIKVDGLLLSGYLRHRSFLENLASGQYENFTRMLFERHLKPGMIVVDGGAHIGYYSLIAAKRMENRGQIFAFEPDPYNFAALITNIRRNHCSSITALSNALADSDGHVSFYQSSSTIGSSLAYRPDITRRRIEVQSVTLDSALSQIPLGDILIKLDIEGGEPLALHGMIRKLERSHSVILFTELNPGALRSSGFEPADLIAALKDLGFEVYFIDEVSATLLPIGETILEKKGNLYCRRGS